MTGVQTCALPICGKPGLDHLGFQAEDASELAQLRSRASAAELAVHDEGETTCCYARSDKHWITDPQGVAWEQFHTLADIPVFNLPAAQGAAVGCCAAQPVAARQPTSTLVQIGEPASACCGPSAKASTSCC